MGLIDLSDVCAHKTGDGDSDWAVSHNKPCCSVKLVSLVSLFVLQGAV